MKKPCSASDPLWYKDAIIYELHVRAFSDSNGDGIGDFQGLISRLDYLQDLGVTCLWLLPFFPSPGKDDGYDIADYISVNPDYGTIADFQEFLDAAHARNMQVMIELVINHTSDQHPWFQAARHAPKGSPERNMYVWSDTDKLYEGVRIIFTDTEKSNWTWDDVAGQFYWHRFFSHQPDLNFDNPRVMQEVLNAMRFWMDMGVDGLRLDAIPYLIERDGTSCENVPETHDRIKEIRAAIDAEYENRLVLAEANMWPADVRPYFGDGDECNMAFHFPLMPRIYMAVRQEDRLPITDIMAQTPPIPDSCQWGLFLRNHDELTLEMVTDEERDYMNMAYASDPRMRINVGIRRRLAPLVDNNRRRIELLNSLLLSFPGTPIMYYGDEIGMGDNIYLGDRNGVRTPMQWNSDRNAGFSKAVPARLYFPVIMDPIWGYQAINVEAQQSDPSSLLHWTRNMIALRKLFQVFGRGSLEFLHPENRKVLAYIRDYAGEHGDRPETILCVANLSRFAQPVALDLARFAGRQPMEMLGYVPFPTINEQPYAITLAPYSFLWLEVPPALEPQPVPSLSNGRRTSGSTETALQSAAALLHGTTRAPVEALLPGYLRSQRWFGGKSRSIESATVGSVTALGDPHTVLAVVDVRYTDGSAEDYQLPLRIADDEESVSVRREAPRSILATLEQGAVLYDATASETFHQLLVRLLAAAGVSGQEAASRGPAGQEAGTILLANDVEGSRSPSADIAALASLSSRIGAAEQSNTSIVFDQAAILKFFRRLQAGENPDVEICRFLTDVAHYENVPAYLGELHRATDGATLAFLQAFAPNQGDGWAWFQEELTRFYESVARCPLPASVGKSPSLIEPGPIPAEAHEHAGLSLEAAALLGRRTAEMHLALATPTDDPAFMAVPATVSDMDRDAKRLQEQAFSALAALGRSMASLPANLRAGAQSLLDVSEESLQHSPASAAQDIVLGQKIRIHGDYHLGQTLRSRSDFMIVDFEGEPSKPLEERRSKQSPLRDVAGMLRSFSYAVRSALIRYAERHAGQPDALAVWATLWENAASTRFLQGYASTMAARPELLPDAQQAQRILNGYLLEKAFYELQYELNNRPDWASIPLSGLLSLLDASQSGSSLVQGLLQGKV